MRADRVVFALALAGCNAIIGLDEPIVHDAGVDAAHDAAHPPSHVDAGSDTAGPDGAGPPESPDGPTLCVPQACGPRCGPIGDGCGSVLNCPSCPQPLVCGGGGPNLCGAGPPPPDACTPRTCQQLGQRCGPAGDGCGGLLQCGTCVAPQQCMSGHCCAPEPCGTRCGMQPDGCGTLIQCPACPVTDGGCAPLQCAQQLVMCGPAGDGCGNVIDCGPCPAPAWCGNMGAPGTCDPQCAPIMCNPQ
jgi:hypothetical protein